VLGKLKTIKRTGWVNNNIPLPESIADHMYRMSMMAFLITDPEVNKDRLIKICMTHDVAESVVGDITPYDGVSKEDKRRMEEDALKNILEELNAPEIAKEIFDLWIEYEDGTSKEAQVARELDKFEMIVQASEYEEQTGKQLERFFTSTQESFVHPEVLGWAELVRKEHRDRHSADPTEPKHATL
jgi:putative hydrolase of HD superfamily